LSTILLSFFAMLNLLGLSSLFSLPRLTVQLTSVCCSAVLSLYCLTYTVDQPAVQEGDPLL
jgi:hypothetical protein